MDNGDGHYIDQLEAKVRSLQHEIRMLIGKKQIVYICSFDYCDASRIFANEQKAIDWVAEMGGSDASYIEMEVE